MLPSVLLPIAALFGAVWSCDDHDWSSPVMGGYVDHGLMKRHDLTKRIQPGALVTSPQEIKDLHWGQINFLHTTDTHGWLAGHLLDENYSADYGDFADFVNKMKARADELGVDLLLVDSGDLHDGTGFGDATKPNGAKTMPIFKKLPYDLLSIGNHELYKNDIANETYHNFAPHWSGRYVTGNVDFNDTGVIKPFSDRYAYWTTKMGVRIMGFGFLFNFTGNGNASVVTPVGDAVQQPWFQEQVRRTDIDMFVVTGHITLRHSPEWGLIYAAIREHHPTTPIQIFGGHHHIRDSVIFDASAMGIASGKYCETVGWVSVDGLPEGATRAKSPQGSGTKITQKPSDVPGVTPNNESDLSYTRQYLDFNRYSFEFHTSTNEQTFNSSVGVAISENITTAIESIPDLTVKLGCAPDSWYNDRAPVTDPTNVYHFLTTEVYPKMVVDEARTNMSRIVLINTGAYRNGINKGPFTWDTAYQTNPFKSEWWRTTAPWSVAKDLLSSMQTSTVYKRDVFKPVNDTTLVETLGYVTKDDFGDDGDNIVHIDQGFAEQPHYVQANVSVDGIADDTLVDVYVLDFFADEVGNFLAGSNTTDWTVSPKNMTSFETMPKYAQKYWSQDC